MIWNFGNPMVTTKHRDLHKNIKFKFFLWGLKVIKSSKGADNSPT